MKPVSPFLEMQDTPRVQVFFQGVPYEVAEGANLAAALLAAGVDVFRTTPVSGAPRAPFCMMGACFDCLVEIDGVQRQACMMETAQGLEISKPAVAGMDDDQA